MNPESKESTQSKDLIYTPESICIIPSDFFFTEFISIDLSISEKELSDFVELQLESLTPLPLDQILWGYYKIDNSDKALIFATSKSRIEKEGFDSLESYVWVIPKIILSLSLNRFSLEKLKDQNNLLDDSILKETKFCLNEDETISNNSSNSQTIVIDKKTLWAADIRPKEFKIKTKKNRKINSFLNKSFNLSIYSFIIILLCELCLIVGSNWLNSYKSKIDNQFEEVSLIKDQHNLIYKLEQISENQLRPVSILRMANKPRLDISPQIVFDNLDINEDNEITITGTAGNVNQINRYNEELAMSKNFEIIKEAEPKTTGGKTTFTIKLKYNH